MGIHRIPKRTHINFLLMLFKVNLKKESGVGYQMVYCYFNFGRLLYDLDDFETCHQPTKWVGFKTEGCENLGQLWRFQALLFGIRWNWNSFQRGKIPESPNFRWVKSNNINDIKHCL